MESKIGKIGHKWDENAQIVIQNKGVYFKKKMYVYSEWQGKFTLMIHLLPTIFSVFWIYLNLCDFEK